MAKIKCSNCGLVSTSEACVPKDPFYEKIGVVKIRHENTFVYCNRHWRAYTRDCVTRLTPFGLSTRHYCGGWVRKYPIPKEGLQIYLPQIYKGLKFHNQFIQPWFQLWREFGLEINIKEYKSGYLIHVPAHYQGTQALIMAQVIRTLCQVTPYHGRWKGVYIEYDVYIPKSALFWKSIGYPTHLALYFAHMSFGGTANTNRIPILSPLMSVSPEFITMPGSTDPTLVFFGREPKVGNVYKYCSLPVISGISLTNDQQIKLIQELSVRDEGLQKLHDELIRMPLDVFLESITSYEEVPVTGSELFDIYEKVVLPIGVNGLMKKDLAAIIKSHIYLLLDTKLRSEFIQILKNNWETINQFLLIKHSAYGR